jgi:methylmalonyl-CoA/ethylmalonyl-CoA epimerase
MKENTTVNSAFSDLDHVAIVVRDMDKTLKRLESLGIGPFKEVIVPEKIETALFHGKPFHAKVNAGLYAKMGNIALEVIHPSEDASPWKEFLDEKGEGIHHISYYIDNDVILDKEVARLTQQGYSIILYTKWRGGGCAYIDIGLGGPVIVLESLRLREISDIKVDVAKH